MGGFADLLHNVRHETLNDNHWGAGTSFWVRISLGVAKNIIKLSIRGVAVFRN